MPRSTRKPKKVETIRLGVWRSTFGREPIRRNGRDLWNWHPTVLDPFDTRTAANRKVQKSEKKVWRNLMALPEVKKQIEESKARKRLARGRGEQDDTPFVVLRSTKKRQYKIDIDKSGNEFPVKKVVIKTLLDQTATFYWYQELDRKRFYSENPEQIRLKLHYRKIWAKLSEDAVFRQYAPTEHIIKEELRILRGFAGVEEQIAVLKWAPAPAPPQKKVLAVIEDDDDNLVGQFGGVHGEHFLIGKIEILSIDKRKIRCHWKKVQKKFYGS